MGKIQDSLRRRHEKTHVKGGHISVIQSHLVAATGEFVGTFFFLWMAYSAQIMALSQAGFLAVGGGTSSETIVIISLIYSLSLLVNAWAFYRISGGLFNPAVSLRRAPLYMLYLSGVLMQDMAGRTGSRPRRPAVVAAHRLPGAHADPGLDGRRRAGARHVRLAGPSRREHQHAPRGGRLDCPGPVHRDVPDGAARVCRAHAGRREVKGHVHGAHRDRAGVVCGGADW